MVEITRKQTSMRPPLDAKSDFDTSLAGRFRRSCRDAAGLASPVGAAGTQSSCTQHRKYAVATATHDHPAHVVTAVDVANASA